MNLCILLTLVAGSTALRIAAQAQVPASNTKDAQLDAELKNELESLAVKIAGISSLSTDFEEKKFSGLLKKPLVSKGTMRVVGTRSRWDTTIPKRTTMTVDPNEVRIYYPERSTIEVYQVDERLRWLTVWPLPKLSTLADRFLIERIPVEDLDKEVLRSKRLGIRLHPRDTALSAHLLRVDVVLDTTTGLAIRVEILDADDDRTVISFTNTSPNPGIKESDLELIPPVGTHTVRPLANLEKETPAARP